MIPKRISDDVVMGQGFADEAMVIVKGPAYEDMVTYLRIKADSSDLEVGGEGWNRLMCIGIYE